MRIEREIDSSADNTLVNTASVTAPIVPAIQTKGITVTLRDKVLVSDVSLSVKPNEILAIIGPSGCGKTTFLSTLNRMTFHTLPAAIVTGDILLNGEQIYPSTQNPTDLRSKIAMLFQRPNPFPFSIRKNMEFALNAVGNQPKKDYPDLIEQNLRAVNLWDKLKDRLNDNATRLSGGEQQRLCIARALLCNPDVVLLDEPCSALDPISSIAVEGLIKDLKKSRAVVIVTHNLAQASRISDQCAFMYSENNIGKLVEASPTHQIMTNPTHETTRAYINGEVC